MSRLMLFVIRNQNILFFMLVIVSDLKSPKLHTMVKQLKNGVKEEMNMWLSRAHVAKLAPILDLKLDSKANLGII